MAGGQASEGRGSLQRIGCVFLAGIPLLRGGDRPRNEIRYLRMNWGWAGLDSPGGYSRGLTLSGIFGPVVATGIAILCAIAGIVIASHRARLLVPVSGVILVGVTLFELVPELVHAAGYLIPLALIAAAYLTLTLLDKLGYPVCPSCSHGEAFAEAFIMATGLHAFVDGWGMSAVSAGHIAPMAIGGAILFHKIPEGFALGGPLRGARLRPSRAILFAVAAEAPTVAGGFVGLHAAPGSWMTYILAVAAGTFLFFGVHAVEGWWIRTNLQSGSRLP